jgi:hypothetical protein
LLLLFMKAQSLTDGCDGLLFFGAFALWQSSFSRLRFRWPISYIISFKIVHVLNSHQSMPRSQLSTIAPTIRKIFSSYSCFLPD